MTDVRAIQVLERRKAHIERRALAARLVSKPYTWDDAEIDAIEHAVRALTERIQNAKQSNDRN